MSSLFIFFNNENNTEIEIVNMPNDRGSEKRSTLKHCSIPFWNSRPRMKSSVYLWVIILVYDMWKIYLPHHYLQLQWYNRRHHRHRTRMLLWSSCRPRQQQCMPLPTTAIIWDPCIVVAVVEVAPKVLVLVLSNIKYYNMSNQLLPHRQLLPWTPFHPMNHSHYLPPTPQSLHHQIHAATLLILITTMSIAITIIMMWSFNTVTLPTSID